jgi:hypothetical protein
MAIVEEPTPADASRFASILIFIEILIRLFGVWDMIGEWIARLLNKIGKIAKTQSILVRGINSPSQ